MDGWSGHAALFAVGIVAGAVNVLAGGGSFLTLPVLMFLGLPPGIANGTNRVGIFVQNVAAVSSFSRARALDWRSLWWAAVPATAGAALGAWLALEVSDAAFKKLLALFMVALTLWSLWSSRRDLSLAPDARIAGRLPFIVPGFFLVGIYGGFVQAGVGFLVLAVLSLTGLDLVRGNAIKVLAILCLTLLSLCVFAWHGRVIWSVGLVLAAGTLLGGLLGARLTVLKGHRWVRGVVTVTVLLFAAKLLLG